MTESPRDTDWISRRWQGEGHVVRPTTDAERRDAARRAAMRAGGPPDSDLQGHRGAHCALCRELDLLPTHCDGCGAWYCGSHAAPSSHDCAGRQGAAKGPEVLSCPLCSQIVAPRKLALDVAMHEHIESGCKLHLPHRADAKHKCGEKGCYYRKHKLPGYMATACQRCGKQHCPKHKGSQHACTPARSAPAPYLGPGAAAARRAASRQPAPAPAPAPAPGLAPVPAADPGGMIRTLSAQERAGRAAAERAGAAAVLEAAALDGELVRTRSEIEREATALGRDVAAAAGPGVGPGAAVAQVMAVAGVSRAAAESLLRRAGGRGVERAIDLHFSQ